MCRPKDQGGLGIENLEIKNKCLFSKWLYKILNEEDVWQELLHNKYLNSKKLSQIDAKPSNSLMMVKSSFVMRGSFKVGDGQSTRFWEDTWLGDTLLALQYQTI